MGKAIKISNENYRWLLNIAAELQKKKGRVVSFDEAFENIKNEDNKKSIFDFAGSWKLSSDESKKIIKTIMRERKITSRRL